MSVRCRNRALVAGVIAMTLAFTAATPAQAAAQELPVPYGYEGLLLGPIQFLADPDGSPAGANDWSCKPSAAHPNPVVLVHGAGGNMTMAWATMSPLLRNNGYCVFALNYGVPEGSLWPLTLLGGRSPMEQSAVELGAFIDEVLAATGAAEVDIVGHSEGSLMPNYYVKFMGGAAKVDKYIGLTPLWKGSELLGLHELNRVARMLGLGPIIDTIGDAVFPAALQFLAGSEFLVDMSSNGGPAVPGVRYTNVMSKFDEAVWPSTSGKMAPAPNVTNVVLQDLCWQDFSGHGMVAFSPNTAQVVFNALDPAHAQRIRCRFVPPSP